MSKHTLSPWSLSGDLVVGAPEPRPNPQVKPYPHVVCKLCWDFNGDRSANGDLPWSIAEANGYLIVQAPAMFAAIEQFLNECERGPEWISEDTADRMARAYLNATGGSR